MAQRVWSQEEDKILQHILETNKLNKWSHIAKKLQEDYGIKGHNGKQCKQRYTTHIDKNHPKQDWSYEDEQKMFQLHNQLGNKWAIIGSKLGGRSDNCIKNHFYSKLRKGLKKVNSIIQTICKKQFKQIKPNILYRIVEVTEQKFKLISFYQKDFCSFAAQLKGQLLEFAYEDNVFEDNSQYQLEIVEQGKDIFDKINYFSLNYKKKLKKQRRCSAQGQDLLSSYQQQLLEKCNSQNDWQSNPQKLSHQTSNLDELEENLKYQTKSKKSRKTSQNLSANLNLVVGIRTRSSSDINKISSQNLEKTHQIEGQKEDEKLKRETMELQGVLDGLKILEGGGQLPPHPLMMKKQTSRFSKISEHIEKEEYRFFEDSQIEMRIIPQMDYVFQRDDHIDAIFSRFN